MHLRKTLASLLLLACPLVAESVTTDAVGFNKVTCLANSDTIVGVPLRVQGSITTKLAGAPVINGDAATLTLVHNALPSLTKHYLKFNGGTRDGRWYDILTTPANTASSVTIDLNGDNLDGVLSDASVLIAEYWTLDSLFPPAQATTSWTESPTGSGNWVPNGHAVVVSANAISRKTEILIPNYNGSGINLSASGIYYLLSAGWRKVGASTTDYGNFIINPDNYIIVRQNASVERNTTLRSLGEVEHKHFAIPLTTRVGSKQDNFISLVRPLGVELRNLGLDDSAFTVSPNAIARADELLVFNNEVATKNKSASAIYYKLAAGWRKVGGGTTDAGTDKIPAGSGFIIRKAATTNGLTAFWLNPPPY